MTVLERMASIERKRAQLLDAVAGLPLAVATAHPRPGKWSIHEIVEHLVVCEPAIFGDLAALRQVPPRRRALKHQIRYWIVMGILRFDIPVQVPSRALLPTGARSVDQLRDAWEANHRLLRAWLMDPAPEQVDRPLFRHPIAGPMTMVESLRMLEVHLDRHTRQVQALVRQAVA
jgi:uncharacterized damage-inducible protein DinB